MFEGVMKPASLESEPIAVHLRLAALCLFRVYRAIAGHVSR
jgi:hypothetical protein